MTALAQYHRLEATGLWREDAGAQRREVLVSLGDATLMIAALNETALSHWSLPAIIRLNPGKYPALYAPAEDSDEQLELSDKEMIAAIETLRAAIERSRPHPGRLRLWIGLGIAAAALTASAVWLPDALTRQTAALLPEASRAEIGQQLLTDMTRIAGRPCTTPRGQAAADQLAGRVFPGAEPPHLVILPSGIPDTVALPGGIMVARAELVEDHETPEVLAGFMLAEAARTLETDPVLALLEASGLVATFQLLTTGSLPETALQAHAATLLAQPRRPVDPELAVPLFAAAQLSTQPYAYALDISGETTLPLIEADPVRSGSGAPLLGDADWISLQEICNR